MTGQKHIRNLFSAFKTGIAVTFALTACFSLAAVIIAFVAKTFLDLGVQAHDWSASYAYVVSSEIGIVGGVVVALTILGFMRPTLRLNGRVKTEN